MAVLVAMPDFVVLCLKCPHLRSKCMRAPRRGVSTTNSDLMKKNPTEIKGWCWSTPPGTVPA